jgi:hypothetical protein
MCQQASATGLDPWRSTASADQRPWQDGPRRSHSYSHLDSVLFRAEEAEHLKGVASARVEEVVCWLTWDRIASVAESQLGLLDVEDRSQRASFERLVASIRASLAWHGSNG